MDLACFERYRNVLYSHLDKTLSLPTSWSSQDKNNFIKLKRFRLEARYKGYNISAKDTSCVRADFPIPLSCGLFYFEVKIVSRGERGIIAIGFANREAKLTVLPGTSNGSYGYHGNTGKKFGGTVLGKEYGPVFSVEDIIGCGIDFINGHIFYTINGNPLGNAFGDVPTTPPLYPIVGMQSKGEIVEANFGHSPFKYDIESHMKELKASVSSSITEYPINCDEEKLESLQDSLVLTYLIHQGYSATAEAFATFIGKELSEEDKTTMKNRQQIKGLVLSGRMEEAIETTQILYPKLLESCPNLLFSLKVGQFVELLGGLDSQVFSNGLLKAAASSITELQETADSDEEQEKNDNMMKLIDLGRELQVMRSAPENVETASHAVAVDMLTKAFSVMEITSRPVEGPLSELFEQSQREAVNDVIDSAILGFLGKPLISPLERAIEHVKENLEVMKENNIAAYAFANIDLPF